MEYRASSNVLVAGKIAYQKQSQEAPVAHPDPHLGFDLRSNLHGVQTF